MVFHRILPTVWLSFRPVEGQAQQRLAVGIAVEWIEVEVVLPIRIAARLGTDLEKQKLTLPLIRLLANSPSGVATRVRRILAEPHPDRREVEEALSGNVCR